MTAAAVSEKSPLEWSAAVSVAVAAHLLLFVGYARLDDFGAEGPGQGGIEVGLGLLGNLGESLRDSDAGGGGEAAAAAAPPATAPPPPAEPPPSPTPPEPVRQLGDVTVPAAPVPQAAMVRNTPDARAQPAEAKELRETDQQGSSADAGADSPQAALSGAGGAGSDAATRRRAGAGLGDSPGAGGSPGRLRSYTALLARQINRHKHYPMAARRAREEGVVTLSLRIRRDGSVADFRISRSSGSQALDAAVLRMLDRAQPLPAFPASMTEEEIRVDFPVSFSLQAL